MAPPLSQNTGASDLSSRFSHLAGISVFIFGVFIAYNLVQRLLIYRSRAALKNASGASSPPAFPQWDRIYGTDLFRQTLKALGEHRILEHVMQRFEIAGSRTFSSVTLGQRSFFTIEPQNLKSMQALEHKKWSLPNRRKTYFKPLLGDGIFTNDGADWAHSREMLRPNFVRSQIGDVITFEKHVAHLISKLPKDGSTVDMADFFFRLTMDSATEFLFGESTDSLSRDSDEGFSGAFNRGQEVIAMRSRFGGLVQLFPSFFGCEGFEKDQKFVHDFVDYYVEKGCTKRDQLRAQGKQNEEKSDRYIFIDELVSQTDDRTRIRSELLNILLAGRDTTASLLTNVWWVLSKRPDLWTKLQAEIASLDGAHPSFEQLKDLKFLRALLNETLRLYPVVPQNSRQAQEDTVLPVGGGPDGTEPLFVPKGKVVVWSVYAMHRRQDYYGADAESFRPERWLDDPSTGKKGLRPGWEYLPFNGGARICLGQQFALTEASYTTARLCQAFSGIESRDPVDEWRENLNLTVVNLAGAKVGLTAR